MKKDFERELQRRPNVRIWVDLVERLERKGTVQCFGHSLGGGLASLAAAHISYIYGKRKNIRLTTFGQPRIGNIAFAAGHDKLVS